MRPTIFVLTACLAAGGCYSGGWQTGRPEVAAGGHNEASGFFRRMDTGDWMVRGKHEVYEAVEEIPGGAPRRIGYVVAQDYRQRQGGPSFRIWTVTGLDRRHELGHVDQMGRAVRYEPQRGGGTVMRDVGANTLEESVAAIFDTENHVRVEIQKTSERRLAYEAYDANHDGVLQESEIVDAGRFIQGADTNADGVVDFAEFDAIDRL